MTRNKTVTYQPILFIGATYFITWACAFFLAYQTWLDYNTSIGMIILTAVDFLKSASPLLTAVFLLRKSLFKKQALVRFVFGNKPKLFPYLVVALLFAFQFMTFYLFRMPESSPIVFTAFLSAWAGQILLGGGMEEGGWRGYLQPAFEQKVPAVIGVFAVSLVWACWHLPYFFLPGNLQSGSSFLFYLVTTTATAFTLTAIHKLTGSVLLCTLFHGWQNAIVMNLNADMGSAGFMFMFVLQTVVSVILCIKPMGTSSRQRHKFP